MLPLPSTPTPISKLRNERSPAQKEQQEQRSGAWATISAAAPAVLQAMVIEMATSKQYCTSHSDAGGEIAFPVTSGPITPTFCETFCHRRKTDELKKLHFMSSK